MVKSANFPASAGSLEYLLLSVLLDLAVSKTIMLRVSWIKTLKFSKPINVIDVKVNFHDGSTSTVVD